MRVVPVRAFPHCFHQTPRLLRLSRVLRLMDNMRGAVYMRILRLLVVLCLLTHWLACGLYLLAATNAHEPNWLDAELQVPSAPPGATMSH